MNEPYDINEDVTSIKTKIGDIESDIQCQNNTIKTMEQNQQTLAKETVDIIGIMATKTDKNQINTMKAIDDLEKSQKKWWKNLPWIIKIVFILFALSYIAGSYLTMIKMAE